MINYPFFPAFLLLFFSCKNPSQSLNPDNIRLITHNVYYGFTKIPDRKKTWLEWMKKQQPDILSLQELNEYTPEKLREDAAFWGHDHSILLKEEGFPTGITSRFPIEDVQRYLDGFHHGLLRVKIKGIYFYIIHLHPSNWEFRHREIDFILKNISTLPENSPFMLAGDFNTFSPADSIYYEHGRLEPFFQELDRQPNAKNLNNGKLDYGVIKKLMNSGFIDTELKFRPDKYEFSGTFPALLDTEGEHGDLRRLDYIFVSPDLSENILKSQILSDNTTQYLSDHLPVMLELDIE